MRSEDSLKAEIKELKQKCKEIEENRMANLKSNNVTIRDLRKKNKELEIGSVQINDAMNSIIKYLAHTYGEIRIPKDHMDLTKRWKLDINFTEDEYIYTLRGNNK